MDIVLYNWNFRVMVFFVFPFQFYKIVILFNSFTLLCGLCRLFSCGVQVMVSVAGFRFSAGSVLSLNAPFARSTRVTLPVWRGLVFRWRVFG